MKRARKSRMQKEYLEKLRDPRWQKLRLEVLNAAQWRCEWCGAGQDDGRNTQIHHGYYSKGCEPWEYPRENLYVLCEPCHEQAESLKQELFEVQGLIPPWYHQHIYKLMLATLEALERGEKLEVLPPWKPVKRAS